MSDDSKKSDAIPAWQRATGSSDQPKDALPEAVQDGAATDDLLDLARNFLKDETIRNAPRQDKVEFLKDKGVPDDAIEKLLAEQPEESSELKTIHDTSNEAQKPLARTTTTPKPPPPTPSSPSSEPRQEMAPIITYPEFLLKPQKPPPLITVPRLVNAAYVVAGVSALTWGASKYLVEPMIQTLTEARHDFASQTLEDIEKLNDKLEGMVSHVPYIASSAILRQKEQEDDIESLDSDPTELFHRDIATQTSPGLSRSSSEASMTRHALDPTIAQAEHLSGLSYSLRSLVQSLDHTNDSEKQIQKTVDDFQKKLDTMESSYSLLKNEYYSSYSSATNDAKKASGGTNEAQKFKQEIRSLKGAFLSSRNFPSASRPTATSGGYGR